MSESSEFGGLDGSSNFHCGFGDGNSIEDSGFSGFSDFKPSVLAFAPGRTELAGNHTDHQGGKVLTATICEGIEIALRPNGGGKALLKSKGFQDVEIDLPGTAGASNHDTLRMLQPVPAETGTTVALVRGVVAGCLELGIPVTGFDAQATSNIPSGGGLSSSAAFELALAVGLDTLFGTGSTPKLELAKMAQRVEREYFGKPCGLMDQAAVALGGVVAMDFADAQNPAIRRIDCDFEKLGYSICLLDTKCDHSRFQDAYTQVATDMYDVAHYLGRQMLSQVDEGEFLSKIGDVREHLGDRAAMRAMHYYNENHLVEARVDALEYGDMPRFIELTARSGASSAQYLANVLCPGAVDQTPMAVLAMTDLFFSSSLSNAQNDLNGRSRECECEAAAPNRPAVSGSPDIPGIPAGRTDSRLGNPSADCPMEDLAGDPKRAPMGACRIHGGGFGGSVQAFVPVEQVSAFLNHMQQILDPESCRAIKISREGAVARWM